MTGSAVGDVYVPRLQAAWDGRSELEGFRVLDDLRKIRHLLQRPVLRQLIHGSCLEEAV